MKRYIGIFIVLLLGLVLMAGCQDDAADVTPTAVPGDQQPGDQEPGDQEPGDQQPGDQEPGDQEPGDQEPGDQEPGDQGPGDQEPGDQEPGDQEPGAQQPVEDPILINPPAGSPLSAGTSIQHEVVPGEWLMQIARCYGASYTAVRQANRNLSPNFLLPTMKINVPNIGSEGAIVGAPCVQVYRVQPGDTWQGLAQRFQPTAGLLQRANPRGLIAGHEIYVPSTTPAVAELPTLTWNLMFEFDGDLAVWQSADNHIAITPDGEAFIFDVATNRGGELVLLKRTLDAGTTAEVALLNRSAQTLTVLEGGLQPPASTELFVENMLVAPDGSAGAYLVREEGGLRVSTFQAAAPTAVKSISVPHGGDENVPASLFPANDNASFLLLDNTGIYRFDYALETGEQRLVEFTGIAEGGNGLFGASARAWDPSGQYLLLEGFFIEGSAAFVLDPATTTLQPLPESGSYVILSSTSWLAAGTVAVFTPVEAEGGLQVVFYRPEAAEGGFALTEQNRRSVSMPSGGDGIEPGYGVRTPAVMPDPGPLLFAVQGSASNQGLWALVDGSPNPERLNSFPNNAGRLHWVPDGSGVLVDIFGTDTAAGDVVYVPAGGGQPFSLISWLGFKIGDFHWVAP